MYDIMKTRTDLLPPKLRRRAQALGEQLKKARLRRKLSSALVAERARVSRTTLSKLENGDASVSFATVLRLLSIYGLDADIKALAADDELGRRLQDADLTTPRRAPKRVRNNLPQASSDD